MTDERPLTDAEREQWTAVERELGRPRTTAETRAALAYEWARLKAAVAQAWRDGIARSRPSDPDPPPPGRHPSQP